MKRYAFSPLILECVSSRMNSRRSRSCTSASRSSSSSAPRCETAPAQKIRPITAARWRSDFSPCGRWSIRAAISACSVSGIRSMPEPFASASIRIVSSTKSGLPSVFSSSVMRAAAGQLAVVEQRLDQRLRVGCAERLELDRRRAHAAPAPPRPDVEQLGPCEADDQQRDVPDPGTDVLDELEERFLGPVDVLEHEHERLRLGELLGPGTGGPGDLLLVVLLLNRLEHAGGEPEQVRDGLVRAAVTELLDGLVERIVVGDAGGDLDHVREGRIGDALAVGQRPTEEHRRRLERGDELARQAALPHARVAVDREEMGAPVADRPRIGVLEQVELGVAPDERRRELRGHFLPLHADDAPSPDRLGEALDLDRALVLDLEVAERQPVRCRADQDRARLGAPAGGGRRCSRPRRWRRSTRRSRRRPRRPRSRCALRGRAP